MTIRPLAICVLFCSGSALAATADNYAYAWPLQTSSDSAAWQIELTPEIYAAVRDANLRDIEVVNVAGDAVPMAPSAAQTSAAEPNEIELPLFTLPMLGGLGPNDDNLQVLIERDVNGRLRQLNARVPVDSDPRDTGPGKFILDARVLNDAVIDSLWLNWTESAATTTAQFGVDGSDELQQWRVFNVSATVLAMQQNGNSLSRHQITLDGARAKFLRLRRLDKGAALADLHIRARTRAPSSLLQSARVWVEAQPTGTATPQVFSYRLPAPLAAEALKLELATDNSLARVQVRGRERAGEDANAWRTRADFTAFRLHQDDGALSNDEIALSASGRTQEWRVEAATPLDHAPTLRVAYRPDRFVFLAQGNAPYRLVAGSARARRGDYPLDVALAQLRTKLGRDWQPPLATLGARCTLQGESALVPSAPARDWKTWILWAVLIGATALIGGLALSLLRQPR